jgi:hypothetical protein
MDSVFMEGEGKAGAAGGVREVLGKYFSHTVP